MKSTSLLCLLVFIFEARSGDLRLRDVFSLDLLTDLLSSVPTGDPLRHHGPEAAIDPDSVTVSGFSRGAFMSAQLQFAYSSIIRASEQFAGGPYGQNYKYLDLPTSTSTLTGTLGFLSTPALFLTSIHELKHRAMSFAASGHIDPLSNLDGHKVFVYQGEVDPLVPFREGKRSRKMFEAFGADVKLVLWPNATHGIPTDNFGLPCSIFDVLSEGLNNCEYEGVFDMFSHIHPNFRRPWSSTARQAEGSEFYLFDQTPFIPAEHESTNAYMAKNGYIYIPPGCQEPTSICALHVAFHGCFKSVYTLYNILPNLFATKTGYTQVADKNNIVVVFPQAAPIHFSADTSNIACWDFFGGTTPDYAYKSAPQMQAIYNIIATLTGRELIR